MQRQFDLLGDAVDFVKGKFAGAGESGAGAEPSARGGSLGAEPSATPSPGKIDTDIPGPPRTNPADDFIEGEFTPKTSDSKSLANIGKVVGPQVLEGEVVGGAGALSTEGPAAVAAMEGELASGATAAGASLAGVAAVAVPLTVALGAVVAAVTAFKMGLTQAYHDIESLEQFSGELSSANAMGEVRSMMAEIRRSDRLGPQLAELSDVTSRGQEALYEVGTELMAVFLGYAEEMKPLIEAAITAAKITAAGIPALKEQLDLLITLWSPMAAVLLGLQDPVTEANEAIKAIKNFTKRSAEALEGEAEPIGPDPFLDKFFKGAGLPPQPPPGQPPLPPPPAGGP